MAKNQKRSVPAANPTKASTPAAKPAAARPAAASSVRPALQTEWNPDYTHIIKDLRFIGAMVSFFVVVLVILSFILH